jgi:hypothetical protein
MDQESLKELMLRCDFTWAELLRICSEFLGLNEEQAADVMSDRSMERRIGDLVEWSDRQGLLSELTTAVLGYGRSKRAVREWVLMSGSGTMQNTQSEQPYTLLRLESKVDRIIERQDDIIAEQSDIRRRITSWETMAQSLQYHQSPTIDRVMVALLAVAMLGMLAFNVVAIK